MFVVSPFDDEPPVAWLEIGCWLNRHFVAIVNISEQSVMAAPHLQVGATELVREEIREWGSFEWPLTQVADLERLFRCLHIRPTALVGMEFSGAVRLALESQGVRALSVDLRTCDVGGMHFKGDVRLVVGLQRWDKVYLFPPCFQQCRRDECLPYKIADGRAFWGIAMVLWCVCISTADTLLVEQSDTIVADFAPLHLLPDVAVVEAHTADFGDSTSKFLRLTHRNLQLTAPPKRPAPPYEPSRTQFQHPSSEHRDRARSSWIQFPKTSATVAAAPPRRTGGYKPPTLDYIAIVSLFARAWATAGYPVPKDFRNPDARPTSSAERDYQQVRGAGDGREVEAVTDIQSILAPPTLSSSIPAPGGKTPAEIQPAPPLSSAPVSLTAEQTATMVEEMESLISTPGPCGDAGSSRRANSTLRPMTFVRRGVQSVFLVVLCLAARPLVFAHHQGCTLYGIIPTAGATTSAISNLIRRDVAARWGPSSLVFLAGQYQQGPRLYVAAVEGNEQMLHSAPSSNVDGFCWTSVEEIRRSPVADPITKALLTVQALIRPIDEWAAAHSAEFQTGRTHPKEVTSLIQEVEGAPAAWQALKQSTLADGVLLSLLQQASSDPLLDGWLDVVRPLPLDSLPANLLLNLPGFEDSQLSDYPLPEEYRPYVTAKLLPLPPQSQPQSVPLSCPRPRDLYLPEGLNRLETWLAAQRRDLLETRHQLESGVHPDDVQRPHRPQPIAIGQSEMQPWAQGIVWDCRQACCFPLDVTETISSNLSLTFLMEELADYPDQELYSHVVEGVSLEADVELQTVMVPHLTSLPRGFASVAKELRRLQKASWYDFYWEPPFVPFYLNGQGAVARKLEPDRFRRSTEGGGPRKPTYDASGLKAVSINYASRYRYIPAHFLTDERPEFREYIHRRGLDDALERARAGLPSDPNMETPGTGARFTKWPKEVKPTVAEVMQALAVLKHAGALLNQDVYVFGDDLKDYFNQLCIRTPDLWKLNIIFLEEPGDEVHHNAPPPVEGDSRLFFVAEKRLGFGTHGASNVAQRFSYAILDLFRARMDELEARHDEGASFWRQARARLNASCHNTSRFRKHKTSGVLVCPQHRLYAAFMYTDDPIFMVVGANRAMRAISVWRQLAHDAQLLTAIP